MNWRRTVAKTLLTSLLVGVMAIGLVSCGSQTSEMPDFGTKNVSPIQGRQISEVSPPAVIQQLRQALDIYQPQVKVLSPQPDEVLQDTTVTVQLQVQDLPIFKDAQWGLGPHLEVFLDNQPYQSVYELDQPLVLQDLEPGTHTLRVFAARPWDESFKNEGAYTQTTFHIFTKTANNQPNPALPLLTYSRPSGTYRAEPVLLDFYLTNAPLHFVAQEDPEDNVVDWRVRVTVNGESFVTDQWQPLYLKGLAPGKNWVKLEFLDEQANPIANVFNTTARLIRYEPKGTDTLSKLVRGELTVADVRGIVDPAYAAKTPPTPKPAATPTPIPEPVVTPSPEFIPTPEASPTPIPPVVEPAATIAPEVPVEPTPIPTPTPTPEVKVTPVEAPPEVAPVTKMAPPSPAVTEPVAIPTPEGAAEETAATPTERPTVPAAEPSPVVTPVEPPAVQGDATSDVKAAVPTPTPAAIEIPETPIAVPVERLPVETQPVKLTPPAATPTPLAEKPAIGGFFGNLKTQLTHFMNSVLNPLPKQTNLTEVNPISPVPQPTVSPESPTPKPENPAVAIPESAASAIPTLKSSPVTPVPITAAENSEPTSEPTVAPIEPTVSQPETLGEPETKTEATSATEGVTP